MKEFEPILPQSDKVKIVNQKQAEYQKKFLETTRRYNGHTVFEINCTTDEITEAEFDEERIEIVPEIDLNFGVKIGSTFLLRKDILVKENCLYISALNKKSARKKFLKYLLKNGKISEKNK